MLNVFKSFANEEMANALVLGLMLCKQAKMSEEWGVGRIFTIWNC